MGNDFERTIGLLGQDSFNNFQTKTIAIFGLGGVGGTALECLARTGFKKFILIDFDTVSESNLNRQILYNKNDISLPKVDCAKRHLETLFGELEISTLNIKAQDFIFDTHIDFVIDAIDDVDGKLFIAKKCTELGISYIISLGMANRLDPSKVIITTLNKTFNDPLAKKIRYIFKENGLILSQVSVAFSTENPKEFNGKLNSIMSVPSSAGLNIAYYVIKFFLKEEK